ncbi:hypothetical protein SDC9_127827 [bioreactor metagenome]|uniref:Serine aminopeptidase S33 domain-containing protein n=1 Tax=bioreactor metagenome TaxID=1076179 RepID=A0A645CV28_9ZZZZ
MTVQILNICSYDGYPLDVRICLPESGICGKIILFVNGSGPMTYTTKRQLPDGRLFNYFDVFAEELTKRNIGFCSYSQRGVSDGDTPPYFVDINDEAYKKYLPNNSVSDIENIVAYLRKTYPGVRVILLGWSEGSNLASLVVLGGKAKISALMLAGYSNENLRDILIWQLSGNSTLIFWRHLFDYDRKGYITESDFT